MYKHFFKRILDFCFSLVVLIILFIPLLIITVWLHFANKGAGAFFLQKRPGTKGKVFNLIKFKTMTDEVNERGELLPDEFRLTKIGQFVRSTSIDELPQLFNVLKGDMALIGPRPLSLKLLPLYTKEQVRRHDVRPGISGWAQVNGRNHAKYSEKFANDVWYVDHCTLATDLKIIWMTIRNVLNRSDIGSGAEDMDTVDDLHFGIRLLKFGSDYPVIDNYKKGNAVSSIYPNANYYACGRQAINDLIGKFQWKRIWMPSYFCYDIINYIKTTGIKVVYYVDYPGNDDETSIGKIQFEEGDVLFRMNFFGFRGVRTNKTIPVPVIEDHSHDLVGEWPQNSDADFCIASLRKTLPISEGGILWSPKEKKLPLSPKETEENNKLADIRYKAMTRKAGYLNGSIKKPRFRQDMLDTEKMLDKIPISKISNDSWNIINEIDIQEWYDRKHRNWNLLQDIATEDVKILQPEKNTFNPFSLVLLFKSKEVRDKMRDILINRQTVFPAILWRIPEVQNSESVDFGNRMLSIHCDGRYDRDLDELKERIITAIRLLKGQC